MQAKFVGQLILEGTKPQYVMACVRIEKGYTNICANVAFPTIRARIFCRLLSPPIIKLACGTTHRRRTHPKARIHVQHEACHHQPQDRIPQMLESALATVSIELISAWSEPYFSLSGLRSFGWSSNICTGRAKKLLCVNTWILMLSSLMSGSGGSRESCGPKSGLVIL